MKYKKNSTVLMLAIMTFLHVNAMEEQPDFIKTSDFATASPDGARDTKYEYPMLETLGLTEVPTLKFKTSYSILKQAIDISALPQELKEYVNILKSLMLANLSDITKKLLAHLINNPAYVIDVKKFTPENPAVTAQELLNNALYDVVRRARPEFIDILVSAGAQLDARYPHLLLVLVLLNDDRAAVEKLISAGIDINLKESNGRTALMEMSTDPIYLDHLKLLLDYHSQIDAQGADGRTALYFAAKSSNNREAVKLLLDAGADPDMIIDLLPALVWREAGIEPKEFKQ